MNKIKLLVRLLEDGKLIRVYERDHSLPFVPQIGMRFSEKALGVWKTDGGEHLSPEVERVVYDMYEKEFICVFTVTAKIGGSVDYWDELEISDLGDKERYLQGM